MASTNDAAEETLPLDTVITSRLTSLPREIMIDIASLLDPRSILALIHTSPSFCYLMYIFTTGYSREQVRPGPTYTPLQYFVKLNIERIVILLLENGADPNAAFLGNTFRGKPPLFLAIQNNSLSMVSLLIRYGARVNDRDARDGGYTPLHRALLRYNWFQRRAAKTREASTAGARPIIQIIQVLLAAGADVTARTSAGRIPLHIACGTQDVDTTVVAMLIAAGSDISCRTSHFGQSLGTDAQPLHYAAAAGNTAVVQMLLSAGVDVEVETRYGIHALDLAVIGMHAGTVQLLVDSGADTSTSVAVELERSPRDHLLHLVGATARWGELVDWFYARVEVPADAGYTDGDPRWTELSEWAGETIFKAELRDEKCGYRELW